MSLLKQELKMALQKKTDIFYIEENVSKTNNKTTKTHNNFTLRIIHFHCL